MMIRIIPRMKTNYILKNNLATTFAKLVKEISQRRETTNTTNQRACVQGCARIDFIQTMDK